jgi:hypothetical protein
LAVEKVPVMPVISSIPGVEVVEKVIVPELVMPLPLMVKQRESANAAGEIARAVANASKANRDLFTGLSFLEPYGTSFIRIFWLRAFKVSETPRQSIRGHKEKCRIFFARDKTIVTEVSTEVYKEVTF